jgi:hypothetical protein
MTSNEGGRDLKLSGVADLPLHTGHVPPWLIKIMRELSIAILEVMVDELGPEKTLKRFSNPLWFQAFNNVIGMDWDSSGSTTVTTAIVKEALRRINADLRVVGGKGRASLNTLNELEGVVEELGLSTTRLEELKTISRLGAKADTALLQDGFSLYHHAMMIDSRGDWVIIQQGMNPEKGFARRYHLAWYVSEEPITEPHSGIASDTVIKPLNLVSRDSLRSRDVILDLMREPAKRIAEQIAIVNNYIKGQKTLLMYSKPSRPLLRIPYYRPVKLTKAMLRTLNLLYERQPSTFKEGLLERGVGPEVLRALSLISELIYREPPSLHDPVTHPYDPFKYSYAVGGKDGIPYPVKKEVALSVIRELKLMIENAKLGNREKLRALKALKALAPPDMASF